MSRSVVGSVVYLVMLHGRRRPGWALAVVVATAWLAWPPAARVRTSEPVQPAVFTDGFGVMVGTGTGRRVIALDRDGHRVRETPVRLAADARMIGTQQGTALGWLDGSKLRVAALADDGTLRHGRAFGRSVRQLCAGVASNDLRFGIAYLEADGRVWFVHGPKTTSAASVPLPVTAATARTEWCGIASAHDNIALLWRTHERTYMTLCTRKECSRLTTRVPIENERLLGVGCVGDGCLFASRDGTGHTLLRYVTQAGKISRWSLDAARADAGVHVVGAGDRAFAIAYVGHDGAATVVRLGPDGRLASVWRDPAIEHAPALAWSTERLLIAGPGGASMVVAMPR